VRRPGRGTARATGGAWREGRIQGASRSGVWGKCAGTRSACGLRVRGSADTEATGARARCRRTERVRPISILLSACLKLINSKNLY
jgi:hypothetical protein